MNSRIRNLLLLAAMGAAALLIQPPEAAAEKQCPNGLVICSSSCPAYPDLVCRGYGCAGANATCAARTCSTMDYTVTCEAPS